MRRRPNYLAGFGSVVWLFVIGLPLYMLLAAAFSPTKGFGSSGPLSWPKHFTFHQFSFVFQQGFGGYFLNTLIVTVAVVGIVLLLVPPLSYAIVRSRGIATTTIFRVFLLGLAIPAQAVIVPMFYIIDKAGLYDNLLGIILPTAAFTLPVTTLVLTGVMRDITPDLYEAMAMDGASPWRVFFQLVLPLSKSGISTIIVFASMQAWNGFIFPLILTNSNSSKVITLGLFNFQTEYGTNVPAMLCAVLLSMIPVLVVYLCARRTLVQGLMGVGGK